MVSLKIYNDYGVPVATLINEVRSAGYHSVNFNASKINLSPGLYYYELKTHDFVESKKMILIK
jgi:hypothetical protein